MDTKNHVAEFHERNIQITISIPENTVMFFLRSFGDHFKTILTDTIHDGYARQADVVRRQIKDTWKITVTIDEDEEDRFWNFFVAFCEKHELSFKDPRTTMVLDGRGKNQLGQDMPFSAG
jgi:hypothetical protein